MQVTAKSLPLALIKAGAELGVTQEDLGYSVIKEKERFLGLFGSSVTIVAWPANGKHSDRTAVDAVDDAEVEEIVERMRVYCENVCERMLQVPVEVATTIEKERVIFDISGAEVVESFDQNAKLYESFEHILRKFPGSLKKILPHRIFVDAGGQRRVREKELMKVALDLSEKVSETCRPVVLNYKSPYDRKVIHMALDKDDRVYTKSIGHGQNRKLMILPSKGGDPDEVDDDKPAW